MDLTTTNAIVTILFNIIAFLIQNGPAMIADIENIFTDLKLAYEVATSGTTFTAEQQAQIDLALDNAHNALQAAIAAKIAQNK